MITRPCNVHSLALHNNIEKLSGVFRGMHYFLNFALKHRLWVLVNSSNVYQQSYVLSKNKKTIAIFHMKMIMFTAVEYCSILHRCVFGLNAI